MERRAMTTIAVAGTNFHHLTLAELERANRRTGGAASLAARMRDAIQADEVVALVTCNRIEVYVAVARELAADEVAHAFHEQVGAAGFAHVGEACERHLLRVASSLESAVIGEDQILGQVRDAFAAARDAATSGPRLASLFDNALRVGKRVRRETDLAHLGTDLARLALRHVKAELRGDAATPIALLGTGDMARAVLAARPKDARDGWLLIGRDAAHTQAVAEEFGVAFQTQAEFLADVRPLRTLIAATSTPVPLIDAAFVARRLPAGAALVDLGMPRNIEPALRAVGEPALRAVGEPALRAVGEPALRVGVRLADLGDLRGLATENASRLSATVTQIENWIEECLARRARRAFGLSPEAAVR
jgi:glutamyl-tRNA reductase